MTDQPLTQDIETAWLLEMTATVQRAGVLPPDRETVGRQIAAIVKLRRALEEHRALLAEHMHDLLDPRETYMLDGVGAFTRTRGSKSVKYDNEKLLPVVLDSTRRELNTETGELEPVREEPWQKVVRVWTMPPSKAPSTRALKEYGIEGARLDEFRTSEDGRLTVKFEEA